MTCTLDFLLFGLGSSALRPLDPPLPQHAALGGLGAGALAAPGKRSPGIRNEGLHRSRRDALQPTAPSRIRYGRSPSQVHGWASREAEALPFSLLPQDLTSRQMGRQYPSGQPNGAPIWISADRSSRQAQCSISLAS